MHEMMVRLPRNSSMNGTGEVGLLEDLPLEAALAETKKRIASAFEGQPVIKVSLLVPGDEGEQVEAKAALAN